MKKRLARLRFPFPVSRFPLPAHWMGNGKRVLALGVFLALATALAAGETLQGTVTNGTTSKPASGAEVTLLSLAQGMTEIGHTKSDGTGRFRLEYTDSGTPHLVQVTYQDAQYYAMAAPGTNSVQVQVYDSAKKLDGISTTVEILRLQSDGSTLQIQHLYAVQNASKPARTLIGDHPYEIALPSGAVIDQAAARAPGGEPLNVMPDAIQGQKDRYSFSFPLRPGETQFQVAYHLPYSGGQATVEATVLHNVQHFVAMLPTSMRFTATGIAFLPMAEEKTVNVQVATNAHAGDRIVMNISGTGVLAEENGPGEQTAPSGGNSAAAGPGGGLGRPIGSPDPLSRYRWPLLGGLAVVLVAGGFYVATRRPLAVADAADSTPSIELDPEEDVSPKSAQAKPVSSSLLLDAMKDELFQLEMDHQQGRISDEEYQKAKAALDITLRRALDRAGTK